METVHIFISTGRFKSFEEMRAFVDETYPEDGDGVPSEFIREVGLTEYEPGSIECEHRDSPIPLSEFLVRALYSNQWMPQLDRSQLAQTADALICVFEPIKVARPHQCSIEHLGGFEFQVIYDEWFLKLTHGNFDQSQT